MSEETIIAVYDTAAHAEAAVAGLKGVGVMDSAITMHAGTGGSSSAGGSAREEGFWSSLFGGQPDHDTAVYDRSVAGGSTVVSVKVADTQVTTVMQVLESHHPIDIDERAAGYGLTQTTTTTQPLAASAAAPTAASRTAATGDAIQLAEESLVVGKRLVNRGGTRIRRYVVETPVEQDVTLQSEKVTLDRRPVTDGRVAADSFSEKTIEMTETAEEAVVGKTSRVVEEVSLRKEATERVETVRDTVRKEEIEVVKVPGTTTTSTTPIDTTLNPRTPKI